jgi:hypothetical protein
MRRVPLVLLLALAVPLAGCGGDDSPAPPGSKENPLAAHESSAKTTNEGQRKVAGSLSAKTKPPGYTELLARQSPKPRDRFTPCSLVTRQQARAIVGAPVLEPIEAPQGPTCIYRTRSGDHFVTLAVQPLGLARASRHIKDRQRLDVAGRTAYCGRRGAPVLYASLAPGRVLSVAAPCAIAKRFAARAIAR